MAIEKPKESLPWRIDLGVSTTSDVQRRIPNQVTTRTATNKESAMFKLRCRHWITSLSIIGVAWSSPAAAGAVQVIAPICVDTANGGYCAGTFQGARAAADPNFGVEFSSDIDPDHGTIRPTLTFIATFTKNGVSSKRICSANNDWTGFAQNEGLGAVLRAENYFYVSWDSTGTCTGILIASESSEI